jgi:hypothetical protein
MDFFAIFIGHGGVVGGAGVGSEDYAVFVDEAYDGGARFEGFGEFGGEFGGGGGEEGVAMC